MIRNRWIGAGVLLAVVASLTTVQQLLPRPSKALWWHVVYDAGHVPLFGLFSLLVLGLTLSLVRRPREHHPRHYVFAFGVTALAGCLVEAIQWGAPARTAALLDVARNTAGSAAFLLFAASLDPLMATAASRSKKTLLRVTSVLLIAVSLIPVGLAGAAIVRRNAVFPQLSEFESWLGMYLVDTRNVDLEPAVLPVRWAPHGGSRAAHVTFLSGRPANIALISPYPDWSGYERLEVTIFSELDLPVRLSLRIADENRLPALGDIFLETLTVEPGVNRFPIPLSRVRDLASGREMNMTRIHRILLTAVVAREPFSVWVNDLRLE